MTVFFSQLINGLSLGSIYALIALGYSMVYGIILLLNFAHGDVIMVGRIYVLVRHEPAGPWPGHRCVRHHHHLHAAGRGDRKDRLHPPARRTPASRC